MTPSNRHDDESELAQEIRRAVREAQVEVANYSEGNHTFLKWVLTLCGGLTLAGVIGGIAIFGKVSVVDERTQNYQRQQDERYLEIQRQLDDIKRSIERNRSQP